ncbi:hypothetical protein Sru01_29720 [Sphaerisporangium rufum]|uniref:DUF952 domain-containing protein n=1 Tax=Sphaerisporangium rufum TaxID=1381558 RepID=A0A919R6A3_9ACTN|nr:DUF952 domain-containing protein [Sphaerisporangium rufum]GII77990.1 hypothetical protein Sru01_29720 [Sphaerisporangium rufum]
MTILHLALAADWRAAVAAGEYRVSTLGRTLAQEGFIHACADERQLHGVAGRYYAGVSEPLVVLAIDPGRLGCPVVTEVPPGAAEAFPHIYGPVPVAAVTTVTPYTPAGPPR